MKKKVTTSRQESIGTRVKEELISILIFWNMTKMPFYFQINLFKILSEKYFFVCCDLKDAFWHMYFYDC